MERGYRIRSKPLYDPLIWKEHATDHVVIAHAEGGVGVLKLFQMMTPKQPIKVLFADDARAQRSYRDIISKLVDEGLQILDDKEGVLSAVSATLDDCVMGTQFYIAGNEDFIWAASQILKSVGVDDKNVMKEQCGSLARPVYCVHCKTIDPEVHHNVYTCPGCGRHLFVRDHFSRRLGAYMGLMVDAEEPGNIPEVEEMYP